MSSLLFLQLFFFTWISSSLASKFFPFFSRTSFFSRKTAASSSRTLCQVVFFRRITGAGVGCPSGDGCSCWGWSDVEAVNKFALLLTLNEFLCPKITYANLRIPQSRNLGTDFPHFLIPLQWKKSHAVSKLKNFRARCKCSLYLPSPVLKLESSPPGIPWTMTESPRASRRVSSEEVKLQGPAPVLLRRSFFFRGNRKMSKV